MHNAIMSRLLAIRNGLGLKTVGYCFQIMEFHTYSSNKIVFIIGLGGISNTFLRYTLRINTSLYLKYSLNIKV